MANIMNSYIRQMIALSLSDQTALWPVLGSGPVTIDPPSLLSESAEYMYA